MHHVVQQNLFNEFGFKTLLNALEENQCPYTLVKVVPFDHTLEPEVSFAPGEKVMVWGTLTLDGIAHERGWEPGVFQNENFDMRVLAKRFGHLFLNHDAVFCTFGEMDFDTPMFCRPVHDTKTFTGTLIQPDKFKKWKEDIIHLSNTGYSSLTPDTPVMYATPKRVEFEARFFVVDGIVISGSSYRAFGKVHYQRIGNNSNPIFDPMLDFVRMAITVDFSEYGDGVTTSLVKATPIHKAFVIDVAKVEDEYKVIEVNAINSAGFYDTDMAAVVRALEGMYA